MYLQLLYEHLIGRLIYSLTIYGLINDTVINSHNIASNNGMISE
jgi:hypothetical protein